jgi:co-chaperonin GroES (HSP10)
MKRNETENHIKLVDDNILVYVEPPSKETKSGIIVSEEVAREHSELYGEIVSVGPAVKNFEAGDHVLLPPHGSQPTVYKNIVYHVFKEYSLFAKIVE